MIVHTHEDEFGTMRVHDDGILVDLLFDEEENAVQSRLDKSEPGVPSLQYVRAMCLGGSLVPRPRNILILGLGGGSLPKYYCENFPEARIDIVDMRASLWDIAKKFFQFVPSAKTRFVHEDAISFVQRASDVGASYDIILVDLFMEGPSNVLRKDSFWIPLTRILSPLGFCLSNVWRSGPYEVLYESILRRLAELFNTVARTDLKASQCILVTSHLDPTVLDTYNLVNRVEYDTIKTGVPLSRILRNTRILKK
jgi:spermidine synthase